MSLEKEAQEAPTYIKFSGEKWIKIGNPEADGYEGIGYGATAVTYANANANADRLVKIIRGPAEPEEYENFINNTKKEIKYQSRAASKGLAPRIYKSDFVDNKNNDSPFFNLPYYYIEMDYLSEEKGWRPIFADDHPILACKFINDLVNKCSLVNTEDPQAHFYYNEKINKINMIDYGRVVKCNADKNKCIKKMNTALGLKCSNNTKSLYSQKRGGKSRKHKHKTTRKHKHKTTCKHKHKTKHKTNRS